MSMFYGAPSSTFRNAKLHRSNLTNAESILWDYLSKNKLNNHRFRRQHPIGAFIVDFYCHKAKLAIEIDGAYHYKKDQILNDANRTSELNLVGIKVTST